MSLLLAALVLGQWQTASIDTLARTPGRRWLGMQAIACDSTGALHAAWSEAVETGRRMILYSRRLPDSTWTGPDTVTDQSGSAPALVVEPGGRPHVAYHWPSSDAAEVFHAVLTDSGWRSARLTDNDHYDVSPTIALEADRAHVAWITLDEGDNYRIGYATDRSGAWQVQTLLGSQLGGYGTGAAPFLAVEPDGRAHVSYRGGDYNSYRIHHAENSSPGDTAWDYEILATVNLQDYSSGLAALPSGELLLVASGNDGWGMPFRTCFLRRPAGSTSWDPHQLMTASASAALRGFALDGPVVHVSWEVINGNIATGDIWHCSNASGSWFNSELRADGETHETALCVDHWHQAHCLAVSGPALDSQYVFCINSAPFTGITERPGIGKPARPATLVRVPAWLPRGAADRLEVYSAAGRLVRVLAAGRDDHVLWDGRDLHGRPVPTGTYILQAGPDRTAFTLLR